MRHFVRFMSVFFLLGLCACVQPHPIASPLAIPPSGQPVAETTPTPTPTPVTAEDAYAAALERFRTQYMFPDGSPSGYDPQGSFGPMDENRFALADVDGDGAKELLLEFTTSIYAGHSLYVYGFSQADGTVLFEAVFHPGSRFFTNGMAEAIYSHNQTHSQSLWPYELRRYDPDMGRYVPIASVHACEKAAHPGNFPNPADTDGQGIVVYVELYDPASGSFLSADPISMAEYQSWYNGQMGGALPLDIRYLPLTVENIAALTS